MIRVLHVNDKLSMDGRNPSSVAHLLKDWIPRLAELDVVCSVSTMRERDPGAELMEENGITVYRLGLGKLSPRNVPALTRLLRTERTDIAHLHGFASHDLGRIVSRRLRIPNIVHEHATLQVPFHQRLADFLLRGWTDAAIAVSGSVREFLLHDRYVPAGRIHVIGNSVNLDRFRPRDPATTRRMRTDLSIPATDRIVGTVTRLRAEKGTDFFVRAAPAILENCPDVTLLIAGDGPQADELKQLSEELGVAQQVRFLGFRSDVHDLLSVMDVLVLPSLTEGFPLSLVEGFAAGCPTVATRVGGVPELAQDGVNALLVPASDPAAIAQRTLELLADPERAARLARAARETAEAYGVDAAASRVTELYRFLLQRGAGPRDGGHIPAASSTNRLFQ